MRKYTCCNDICKANINLNQNINRILEFDCDVIEHCKLIPAEFNSDRFFVKKVLQIN